MLHLGLREEGRLDAFTAGLRETSARLSPARCLLALAVVTCLAVLMGILEREEAPSTAVDLVLAETVFSWLVPLLAYWAVGRAAEKGRADRAVDVLARYGGDRRRALGGLIAGTGVRVVLISVVATGAAVIAARGVRAGTLMEVLTSGWVAVLGASCYTALFAFGSLFGRAGFGRAVFLGLDFMLGSVPETAVPFPRAHLFSLIGGPLVADLPSSASTACLLVIFLLSVALGVYRVPA